MSHGLKINNNSGGLVVDSDARGLHYVGQASYLTNTTVTANNFRRTRTRRRYSITLANSAAMPFVAIRPQADRWMSLNYVRRSSPGSATWYIDVTCADATMLTSSLASMTSTASAEVHIFSTHIPSGSSHGLRLYDSGGNPSWDFSAKPLFVRRVLQFPARTDRTVYRGGDSLALGSGIANPWIAPARQHGKDNVARGPTGGHEDSEYVFQTDGAGNLKRVLLITYWENGEAFGSPYTPQPDWAMPAQTTFVLDGGDYA